MTSNPAALSAVLRKHGLHLKKGLGQNFLADPVHLDRIVAAAELTRDDVVIEVGPGVGTLTARLATQAGRVVAVELDSSLLPALRETLAGHDNVAIVQGDILQLDPAALAMRLPTPNTGASSDSLPINDSPLPVNHYKVVANLPYYITSAAIRHLLTAAPPPVLLALTVQREVAQRIVASPPQMSLLAVSVQYFADPEIVARIPAGAFYPPPKVDSAILRLRLRPQPAVNAPSEETFFRVVRAGFSQPRKQLHNSLKSGLALPAEAVQALLAAAGIAPERRAETLTLEEWGRLASAFSSQPGGRQPLQV